MENKKVETKKEEVKQVEDKKIFVEREVYTKNDKQYFSHFIKGIVRGKEIRVLIVPPDNGGYAVLEIVYADQMAAELVLTPYEIKDDNGRVIKGNTYAVRSVDEDGVVYECKVKPFRESDKALLNMLLR